MKIITCSILFVLLSLCSFSQSQSEMNETENKKFLQADKQLNIIYQKILKEYKADTAFIKALKSSQRLWIQFRDAEMKMMYPDREPGYYGSSHPMCLASYKTELTNERIKKLNRWLEGQEEGDVCSPSIKTKQ